MRRNCGNIERLRRIMQMPSSVRLCFMGQKLGFLPCTNAVSTAFRAIRGSSAEKQRYFCTFFVHTDKMFRGEKEFAKKCRI